MGELLRAEHLTKYYAEAGGRPWRKKSFRAVDDVSFTVDEGETVGLLGESGCGKTTVARMLLGLVPPTSGHVFFRGREITRLSAGDFRPLRRDIQMIFQNPFASLDPHSKIRCQLLEPLRVWKIGTRETRTERILRICEECGLPESSLEKRPGEFSGGQLQRISIARALLMEPRFLVADEIVSALDTSVQDQILRLLMKMKEKYGLSLLFITHDLSVIRKISDQVMVMRDGRLLQKGSYHNLFAHPTDDYVRLLKNAVFDAAYCDPAVSSEQTQ